MDIELEQVEYHRNGIGGEGFYAVLFRGTEGKAKGERLLGIVFDGPGQCAVISLDRIAEHGVAFGHNSWRGDTFEPELRRAIEGGQTLPPRPAQRADGDGSVKPGTARVPESGEWKILVHGNPVDGYEYTGPFADEEDAADYGERHTGDGWSIATMDYPAMEPRRNEE